MSAELQARVLIAGEAAGEVLRLDEPLSLWGGLDPETGLVIDPRHPQHGEQVTDKVLVLPYGRGSSSASAILLESVRQSTAPAAIVLQEVDGILALGAAVAREMYERCPPVMVVTGADHELLVTGADVAISQDGRITGG